MPPDDEIPRNLPLEGLLDFIVGTVSTLPHGTPIMTANPEPNPDGSYTLTEAQLIHLRSCLTAAKQHANEGMISDVRDRIDSALALIPTKQQQQDAAAQSEALIQKQILEYEAAHYSPEFRAVANALLERHDKEADKLAERQQAEIAAANKKDIPAIVENHIRQQRTLEDDYQTDLKRYMQEDKESQKILSRMDTETRKKELSPDEPDRPKHSF